MSTNNHSFQFKFFTLFTIFFVFRSDQKHIIEHCQASFSQNNLQVIQKQDLTRSYSYISAENSLNDADQEKNNTHVKHTAETTDFHND